MDDDTIVIPVLNQLRHHGMVAISHDEWETMLAYGGGHYARHDAPMTYANCAQKLAEIGGHDVSTVRRTVLNTWLEILLTYYPDLAKVVQDRDHCSSLSTETMIKRWWAMPPHPGRCIAAHMCDLRFEHIGLAYSGVAEPVVRSLYGVIKHAPAYSNVPVYMFRSNADVERLDKFGLALVDEIGETILWEWCAAQGCYAGGAWPHTKGRPPIDPNVTFKVATLLAKFYPTVTLIGERA